MIQAITPWSRISLMAFIKDVLTNGERATVVFTVARRPDVATRTWYSLTWLSADGDQRTASAQYLDLMLARAAEIEMDAIKRLEATP